MGRWKKVVQHRMTMDRAMTNRSFGRKALPNSIVKNTWKGTLENEKALPDKWVWEKEVLVGYQF